MGRASSLTTGRAAVAILRNSSLSLVSMYEGKTVGCLPPMAAVPGGVPPISML